jgi:hypothetical protein
MTGQNMRCQVSTLLTDQVSKHRSLDSTELIPLFEGYSTVAFAASLICLCLDVEPLHFLANTLPNNLMAFVASPCASAHSPPLRRAPSRNHARAQSATALSSAYSLLRRNPPTLTRNATRRREHTQVTAIFGRKRGGDNGTKETERAGWEALILEFEERSSASSRSDSSSSISGLSGQVSADLTHSDNSDSHDDPMPPAGPLGRENPAQYESLPIVESALMTAVTAMLWYLGRVLRLDSLLTLLYPLPTFVIMMRWGQRRGNAMVFTTTFLILSLMGPLYGILYGLNTGLLAFVLANAFWLQWNWALTILAGCGAKFIGLFLQLSWTSAMVQYDSWKMIGQQVKATIDGMGAAAFQLLGKGAFSGPSLRQVYVGVAALLAIHSLFHVLFVHLASTMVLDRMYDAGQMKRRPKLVPFLDWIKDRVNHQYDKVHKNNVYRKLPDRAPDKDVDKF